MVSSIHILCVITAAISMSLRSCTALSAIDCRSLLLPRDHTTTFFSSQQQQQRQNNRGLPVHNLSAFNHHITSHMKIRSKHTMLYNNKNTNRSININTKNEKKLLATTKKSKENTTVIEDGSPVGVAIVALGGAYVVLGENQTSDYNIIDNDSIWIVFCTASIAAGILRLIRYIGREKEE